jgi:hypothetical protein
VYLPFIPIRVALYLTSPAPLFFLKKKKFPPAEPGFPGEKRLDLVKDKKNNLQSNGARQVAIFALKVGHNDLQFSVPLRFLCSVTASNKLRHSFFAFTSFSSVYEVSFISG